MRTLFYETLQAEKNEEPTATKLTATKLTPADAEEQKEDEVAGGGREADEVEAAFCDALALLGGGGQGIDDHLSWDLE
jgi:hypothetical protein